ncbi:thiamine pyrophosphate-dependent enzyme [Microtetraspora niveoalba]|uniref:thiamine pyrophosphate-dependent enzyme n=1 Tax=Microtetraspora niveoalba TaxID=46175 RepID=UPI0008336244|nr:thiamine pyrophosphate-dependent enzyme [Microtetraspora niveoalba]
MTPRCVRDAVFDVLAQAGVTDVFGNPGTTEIPFLVGMGDRFRFVHALQETVVIGAAAGYGLASGRPGVAVVHAVPGLGNGMGALSGAAYGRAPVVVLVGQQDSRMLFDRPLLSGPIAEMAGPLVKYVHEPVRPQDVPRAVATALRMATSGVPGPTMVVLPCDFADVPGGDVPAEGLVAAGGGLADAAGDELVAAVRSARNPAIVAGTELVSSGGWHELVELASALDVAVYSGGMEALLGFPTSHPAYRGELPLQTSALLRTLGDHDLVLLLGNGGYLLYTYDPEPLDGLLARTVLVTEDPEPAARFAGRGSVLAPPAAAVRRLLSSVALDGDGPGERITTARSVVADRPDARPSAPGAFTAEAVLARCAAALTFDRVVVDEAISNSGLVRATMRPDAPRSYLRAANAALGFGISAAVGAQVARPDSRVVAILGDGAFQYAPQTLWTAARSGLPVVFIVLNNGGYKILHDYAEVYYDAAQVPGLAIDGVRIAEIAAAYGVDAWAVGSMDELDAALERALSASGPVLLDVAVAADGRSAF